MLDFLHDFHLILDLLVQNAVLHEPALIQLLGRIRMTSELQRDFVDSGKSTSANLAHPVVLVRSIPGARNGLCAEARGLFNRRAVSLFSTSNNFVDVALSILLGCRLKNVNLEGSQSVSRQ